jgi:hypothetical protein
VGPFFLLSLIQDTQLSCVSEEKRYCFISAISIHFTFVSCRFCATWVHFFPETFLYFGKMRYSTDPVLLEHEDCMLIPVFY